MLQILDIKKSFGELHVLRGVDLDVEQGDVVAIIGPSGSGKTTLLRCINFLEKADSGTLIFDNEKFEFDKITKKEIARLRRKTAFVFQNYNLFLNKTALQNVTEGLIVARKMHKAEAIEIGKKALDKVGLSDRYDYYPSQLSGGQKQRVAIARALATNPRYLLCDEATSALDPNTTRSILELLREINKSLGVTIIVITHEMKVIDQICDRVAVIDKSCIAEEGRVADVFTNPKSDIARELVLPQERPVLDPTTGGRKLRLIFNGEDTQKPVISEMILACRVPVNVLFADTKSVEGAAYGHMILELPNDEHDAEKVVSWLKNSGLTWKEER